MERIENSNSDFVHLTIYTHPSIVIPSGSDSVNFWFYAPSSSRQALVATETSFPVSRALNCRATIADTFVEIERSGNVADDAADWSSAHQLSPELQAHL